MSTETGEVQRSQDSPQSLSLLFDLPDGAVLQRATTDKPIAGDPPQSFEVAKGKEKLAYVRPPIAHDSDGEPIDVGMHQSGDRELVITVAHREADVRYPLLVDPVVEVTGGPDGRGFPGWYQAFQLYGGGFGFGFAAGDPAYGGGGLYVSMPTNSWFAANAYGLWRFTAPANTYVYRARFYNWQHDPTYYGGVSYSAGFNGMVTPGATAWEGDGYYNNYGWVGANSWWGDFAVIGAIHDFCFAPPCNPSRGSEGNGAQFGIQAYNRYNSNAVGTGSDKAWMVSEWTSIYLGDRRPPVLTSAVPSDHVWSRVGRSISATAHDDGLGLDSVEVQDEGVRGTAEGVNAAGCDGDPYDPATRCPADDSFSVWYELPEGVRRPTLVARDIVGNASASQTWTEKVDRTAPVVSLSGALKDNAQPKRLAAGAYDLAVSATDNNLAQTSGVRRITVKVDGQTQQGTGDDRPEATCDSCSLSKQWRFWTDRYGAGKHTISVTATDYAGNTSAPQTFTVDVARAATAEVGPGTVNLRTGNLNVSRTDVAIDSYDSKLQVSRTYNSRVASAMDPNGALGAGWVSSLPVDDAGSEFVALVDTADSGGDGTVNITTSDGFDLSFTPKTNGTDYESPEGEEDLTLTKPAVSPRRYELRDSGGNVTVFTKVSSGSLQSSGYHPTAIRQPSTLGYANQTTITYEVVSGPGNTPVARPVEITAPPPPGVTPRQQTTSSNVTVNPGPPGTRYLDYAYSATGDSGLATGTTAGTWGGFPGRVSKVLFTATDPATGAQATTTVVEYLYDSAGRLRAAKDPRTGLQETYDYDANGLLTKVTPAGEEPWTLAYAVAQPDEANFGRLDSASRPSLVASAPTATWKLDYAISLSSPYAMTAGSVAAWGQAAADAPVNATAVFPPNETAATAATIYYLDGFGRAVNVARPGGRITTTSYDNYDNAVRELSAGNRERALASANPAQQAALLDTQRRFEKDGTELVEEWGPQHTIQLANGQEALARKHTLTTYDEGAPAPTSTSPPYHLPTTVKVGARVAGQSSDVDVRTTKTEYNWTLRKPTATIIDPAGLNLRSTTVYDNETGLVLETRQPENPAGGDAHATTTVYYTPASNPYYHECGGKPYWTNLPCQTRPVAQPGGASGLPDLPITRYEYNTLNQITKQTDTVGATTRTTTTTYDGAGRETSEETTSSVGTALPAVSFTYYTANGQLATTSTSDGVTRTITREYDSLGRLSAYADADGNRSTTSYDVAGRPATTNDGKGSQTRSYNTAGELVSLQDSAIGAITGNYDADGQLVTERFPNGLEAQMVYDETGAATIRSYVKGATILYEDEAKESIHGQWLAHSTSESDQEYTYDSAGRLTSVADTRSDQCTVRDYVYDRDSNRERQTIHPPAAEGDCDPNSAGTVTTHGYDQADRITDAGNAYDTFGRITAVPAAQAGGTALSNTYHVDDRVRTVTQGNTTHTYSLDPQRRVRAHDTTISGATPASAAAIHHYTDDSDNPTWIAEDASAMRWTRNIEGINGDLIAIQDSAQTVHKAQITNLHGDTVATATLDANATRSAIREANEFGIPTDTSTDRYQWLGAKQRQTALPTGIVLMGQRVYSPHAGRFLQVDPVEGGSANDYDYVNQDPVNTYDLDGARPDCEGRCPSGAGPRGPVRFKVKDRYIFSDKLKRRQQRHQRVRRVIRKVGRGLFKLTWLGGLRCAAHVTRVRRDRNACDPFGVAGVEDAY